MRTLQIARRTLVLHLQPALTSLASSTVSAPSISLVMTAEKVSNSAIKLYSTFRYFVAFCRIPKCIMSYVTFISAIQVDYDLYFSDPTRSSASLVVPFFLGAKSSLTIAMWVQFTQKDEGGIFFSLYSVSYVESIM